jgi:hypothetical protein
MRKLALAVLVVGVLVVDGGAAMAAPVVQPQIGTAEGTATYSVFTGDRTETGTYRSSGQLGIGTYRIVTTTQTGTGCEDSDVPSATAEFRRSDGALFRGTVVGDLDCGVPVVAQLTVHLTVGDRDIVRVRVNLERVSASFRLTPSGGTAVERFEFTARTIARRRVGYQLLDSAGHVFGFGGLTPHGSDPVRAVHIEPTASREGYWVLDQLGQVFAFGDATFHGNAHRKVWLPGEMATGMAATPNGHGYWIVTNLGRVEAFGNAATLGDVRAVQLHAPIVAMVATPSGNGFYVAAADGGVFTFGDAQFLGSMGAAPLRQPVVGIALAKHGGYWLFAADGGVFSFDAPFRGSLGNIHLAQPITAATRYYNGYVMVASDGGVFNFSSAPFFGSLAGSAPAPVVSVAGVN